MLNTTLNRSPLRPGTKWGLAAAGLVVALALTGLTVAAQTFSSLSGSIVEAARRLMAHDDLD